MKNIDQRRQATRRKTLYPLTSKQICAQRSQVVFGLQVAGLSVREIGQIMNLTPDRVRTYSAKSKRYFHPVESL